MLPNKSLGVVLAITGILLFSSKAVMVKLAYQYGVDTVSLLLFRMVFSLPIYVAIAAFNRPKEKIAGKDYAWLILFGFIGYYLASYFDFLGLIYIKASLERLILFIYPTLVLLISFVFLRKKITSKQVIGVVVTYLGVFIIFVSELSISDDSSVIWGSILIFLSALTYASYLVGSGWLIPKFGATAFTSYAMIVSCMAVILHYSLQRPEGLLNFQPEVYWIGLAMAVFATVIPSYLVSFAIKILGASDFSIFGSLGPISTIGLAYLFLSETLTWTQFLGAGVIIGGIVLAEKKKTGLKK
ncbi:MAG: DMT family transporter [Marinoscillum sp.]|uniref:DMT family transporter n=2 Tax=Marinoscillum sp. TaxID=2024838 RepID=UPI0033050FE9